MNENLLKRFFFIEYFFIPAKALEKKDEKQSLKKLFESLQDLTENLQVLQAFLLSISE